jgi:putative membrane protein
MSTLFAFLHHLAAFALVAALAVEFVLLRGALTQERARQLLAADFIFGAAAGAILVAGLLRVMYFEKGPAYYLHSAPFLAKMALFLAVGLLSIRPTRTFLSWRRALREGQVPVVGDARLRRVRAVIHWELAGIALLILCAALMARGVWTF